MSDLMQDAWIAFARSGIPESSEGLIWPRYVAESPQIALVENAINIQPFPITELMTIIGSVRALN